MRVVFTAVLLLAVSQTCEARLGETLEQCTTRYGKPSSVTKIDKFPWTMVTWTVNETIITAYFATWPNWDKCQWISYDTTDPFSFQDYEWLRTTNCGRKSWEAPEASELRGFQNVSIDRVFGGEWSNGGRHVSFARIENALRVRIAIDSLHKDRPDRLRGF